MSKLLTVTISNPVHDTLERYMKKMNNDVPDHMRLSKSKFVDACIKAALESKGVPIIAYKIVEEPVVINPEAYVSPPTVPKKSGLPPL